MYIMRAQNEAMAYSFDEFMFTYSSRFLAIKVEATTGHVVSKEVDE